MFHRVEQKHTSALALSKSDPNTVRFREIYNVGKVETDAVAGKLRKYKGRGKDRTARAPAPRRKVAPRKKSQSHAPRPRSRRGAQMIQTSHTARSHGSEAGSSGEKEDSVLIVTTLSCSLPFSSLLRAVRS